MGNTCHKKYNVLSIMRVLACFLTVRGHYFDRFDLPEVAGKGITVGSGPVVIFFVISGFLAYDGYMNNPHKKSYYRRRMLRILPPYYIVLMCCIVANSLVELTFLQMKFGDWLRYFTFTNMLIPSYSFNEYNNLFGFWTMSCFPIFYLLTPIFVDFMTSLKKVFYILGGGMAMNMISKMLVINVFSIFGFDQAESFANLNPFGTVYLFLFGMAAAYAYRNSKEIEIAVVFAIIFLWMLMMEKNGYVMWGLATAVICLQPNVCVPVGMKAGGVILKFLDANSFNFYLLHLLVWKIEVNIRGTRELWDCVVCIIITMVASELLRQTTDLIISKIKSEIR